MSAAAQSSARAGPCWRRLPRCVAAIPVDFTVVRSGIPNFIPGRAVDLGMGGMGAIVAGEFHPGDPVGIEIQIPDAGGLMRAQAVVRHQSRLRCGVEFLGLSREQQTMILSWQRRMAEGQLQTQLSRDPVLPEASMPSLPASDTPPAHPGRHRILRQLAWAALLLFLVLGAMGWWQWYRAWRELESHLPDKTVLAEPPEVAVPAGIMEQLLVHKVDPLYPEAARRANIQGTVVLAAVIGSDGTVLHLRPISGPGALTSAAVDAVQWWRFQPYRVNGRPIQVTTTLALEFRP
ncbi:MAG TPA: TonB family protein [Terriglobales bacterium]|jgi:protein TonB|nr:TonB family protein [Terriglobales bacterium]